MLGIPRSKRKFNVNDKVRIRMDGEKQEYYDSFFTSMMNNLREEHQVFHVIKLVNKGELGWMADKKHYVCQLMTIDQGTKCYITENLLEKA